MYFQMSNNGTRSTVVIPRCPVNGNVVDAQLAIGANGRLYASYMDGNAQYTPIEAIYSDDHGSTWSTPVDVTNGGRGDKDMLLVDKNNNVMVAYENGGKQARQRQHERRRQFHVKADYRCPGWRGAGHRRGARLARQRVFRLVRHEQYG